MTVKRINFPAAKVEPFKDWKGRRKFLVSCKRHHWYVEVFLEDNAQALLLAHEVTSHGKSLALSEWAVGRQFVGRL